ncbi:hypothetical protein NDN08_002143 [Rhodosorus marinus]|uniref:Uncharacterized protein n=1 Tax=Rhodosorus marinus TaxID=101924 RepID=A0AAV8UXA8_9RHOD|nr:hypothetical protein NDN08_002143 [Rhodosorus marinus]
MQNLDDKEAELNFEFPHGRDELKKWERRRLRINRKSRTSEERRQNIVVGGSINWKVTSEVATNGKSLRLPQSISLDKFEMTVIEVKFKTASRDLRRIRRTKNYSAFVRDHKNEKVDFPAPIKKNQKVHYYFRELPSTKGGVAAIRISHSRPVGREEKPDVYVNDVRISPNSFSADVAGGYKKFSDGNFFGTFIVYYNLEKLTARKTPKVTVSYPDSGAKYTCYVRQKCEFWILSTSHETCGAHMNHSQQFLLASNLKQKCGLDHVNSSPLDRLGDFLCYRLTKDSSDSVPSHSLPR